MLPHTLTHRDDDFNQSQFATFADSVWSVFVAITSSSYPGQVGPGEHNPNLSPDSNPNPILTSSSYPGHTSMRIHNSNITLT